MTKPQQGISRTEALWEFTSLVWSSLKGAPTIIGLVATLLTFAIAPESKVSARLAVLTGILAFTFIVALLESTWRAIRLKSPQLPSILYSRRPPQEYGTAVALCLLEPSDQYSFGDMVSFYYVDDHNFEQLIGVGLVSNVQQDGKIQTVLETPVSEYASVIERLTNNDESVKRQIRVKPTIQRRVSHSQPEIKDAGNS